MYIPGGRILLFLFVCLSFAQRICGKIILISLFFEDMCHFCVDTPVFYDKQICQILSYLTEIKCKFWEILKFKFYY